MEDPRPGPSRGARALAQLVRNLDLEADGEDRYVGHPGPGQGMLFGGMVAAQSVVAAGRSVGPERHLHSLHAYFLRPGGHDALLRLEVQRVRDGRSFTTRRVSVHQGDEEIFVLLASFSRREEGIAHQDPMPPAPAPASFHDLEEWIERGERGPLWDGSPLELRVEGPWIGEPGPARQRWWLRPAGALPEDPLLHTAVLVYASDRLLLSTAVRPHDIAWQERRTASLDHAVWIHREVRLDGWLLYTSESPVAEGAHALILGALWTPDGRRLASVAQEGLIRRR